VSPSPPGTKLATANEDSLVILAMNGDDVAYGELVRRRHSVVRNLLKRLCRDPALADDIAQDVFVAGWQSIAGLRSRAAFGGWLRKLAINRWLEQARKSKPETELVDERSEAPFARVVEQLDLDAALARLAPEVRLCIVLAYNEGMSHSEISQSADLPLGTVKSHLQRGTVKLRELLRDYGDANGR
jgi:RNA polymerase sigma-70 factor (ECF subfamily)